MHASSFDGEVHADAAETQLSWMAVGESIRLVHTAVILGSRGACEAGKRHERGLKVDRRGLLGLSFSLPRQITLAVCNVVCNPHMLAFSGCGVKQEQNLSHFQCQ